MLSKVKSEKIVLERVGNEIQKTDLISNFEANVWVFDLVMSQARFLQ